MSTVESFTYSNTAGRRPGRVVALAGRVLPGIARVQADVEPFARAWERDNTAALTAPGPLWVAMGDSLTQGVGAPMHDLGWVGLVRDRLRADGRAHRVVNLGVSGATTRDVLDRQLPVLEALAPDLVTLMIGSNDLLRPSRRRALVGHVGEILQRLPHGAVVTTLPNPSRVAGVVNDLLVAAAHEGRITVVELRDPQLASWRGRLAADRFHPNAAGYEAIAQVVGDVVSPLGV